MGFEVGDTSKLESQYEKLNNQLLKLKAQQSELDKIDLDNIQSSIDDTGKSVNNVIRQVGRWALAIFAVESAYGFVSSSMTALTNYNQQLASDIEYIRFAIASSLQPIIETIVSWVYKLLQYINYISSAWFNVDLFANATADAMNRTAKSAKDVKKNLAGFDEMTVLSSSSSSTSGSSSPSVDLSQSLGGNEVPGWLKWIADNKSSILSFFEQLVVIAGTLKLGSVLLDIGDAMGLLNGKVTAFKALGIGLIVLGLYQTIQGIVDFIKDPSWENFLTIIQGISLVIAGISLLTGNWITALIALGVALVTYVIQNWDEIKKILGVVGDWIYENIVQPVESFISALWETIVSIIKAHISVIGGILTTVVSLIVNPFQNAYYTIIDIFDGIKTFFQGFVQVISSLFKGDLSGVLEGFKKMFKGIADSLWAIAKAPINLIIGGINSLIRGLNKIKFDVPDWVPNIGGKTLGFNIKEIPRLKSGAIINLPGNGVPVGGGRAIGGEAGAEGILPLTDSQAMEQLGAAIGRYVVVNLTTNTILDGRTIDRRISQVNSNRNFATNK